MRHFTFFEVTTGAPIRRPRCVAISPSARPSIVVAAGSGRRTTSMVWPVGTGTSPPISLRLGNTAS